MCIRDSLEPAKTVVGQAPIVIPQACPVGTTDLGNGTCQEPVKTVLGAPPVVIPQACPPGTIELGNGTCEAPAQVIQGAPIFTPGPAIAAPVPSHIPAPVAECPSGSYYSEGSCLISQYEGGHSVEDTIVSSGPYCYGDGNAFYDSNGRKLKEGSHDWKTCNKNF